jgi:hypothetical protein
MLEANSILPQQDPAAIRLEWFDVDAADSLLFDAVTPEAQAEALKWRALSRLGVHPQVGETPLDSYLRWLAAINGLAYSKPVAEPLADAIKCNAGAVRFVFFLAGGKARP